MKKGLLVFVAALLFAAFVAQPVAAAVDFDLGIKAGVSLAKYKWSDATRASGNLMKPVFGVFADVNFNKSFAIRTELLWLTLGGWDKEVDGDVFEYGFILQYLQLGVMPKVRFLPNGKVHPYLYAGPTLGLLLTAKSRTYVDDVLENDMDIKPFLTSTNYGVAGGVGVELQVNKARVFVDFRYDMGLADINNKGDGKLKTSAMMAVAGIVF